MSTGSWRVRLDTRLDTHEKDTKGMFLSPGDATREFSLQ